MAVSFLMGEREMLNVPPLWYAVRALSLKFTVDSQCVAHPHKRSDERRRQAWQIKAYGDYVMRAQFNVI